MKPDALAEDIDPELQKSLAAHAAMIETDRLLELIDQFAAAEGRMKWAPNKKLHFEVAVIKAIQSLSQVTLNEVIENLSAFRGRQNCEAKPQLQCRQLPATAHSPIYNRSGRRRGAALQSKPRPKPVLARRSCASLGASSARKSRRKKRFFEICIERRMCSELKAAIF